MTNPSSERFRPRNPIPPQVFCDAQFVFVFPDGARDRARAAEIGVGQVLPDPQDLGAHDFLYCFPQDAS